MGRADLGNDPALARNDGRAKQAERLDAAISEWTGKHTLDEVLTALDAASVPAGRIYTAEDIVKDPHYAARGMIERHTLPDGTPIDIPGVVPRLAGTPGGTRWVGPKLGEHTEEVLKSIGFGATQIEALRQAGTV
jgi:crotonobetainyl-CoA:carnitine CoA-transferase CaiB-like acyl-CoA transferase